jgi:hypothetical protein
MAAVRTGPLFEAASRIFHILGARPVSQSSPGFSPHIRCNAGHNSCFGHLPQLSAVVHGIGHISPEPPAGPKVSDCVLRNLHIELFLDSPVPSFSSLPHDQVTHYSQRK